MTIPQLQHTYLFRFKYLTNKAKITLSKLALEKFEDFFDFFIVKRKTVCFIKIQNCGFRVEQELNEFIAGIVALARNLPKEEKKSSQTLFSEKHELFFNRELHKLSVRAINVLFSFGVDDLASFYKVIIQNNKLSEVSDVRNCGIKTVSEIERLKEIIISSQLLNDDLEITPLYDEHESEKVNFNGRIELFFDQKFDQLKTRTKNILSKSGIDSIEKFVDFFSNGNYLSILNSRNCGDKTSEEIEQFRKIVLDEINKRSDSLKVYNFFKDLEIYFFEGNVLRETEVYLPDGTQLPTTA